MSAKPFSRKGLHRLECPECPGYTYSTVANLETVGLPSCKCGSTFEPERLELAELLGVESPAVIAYRLECQSIAHGQASHGQRGRQLRPVELVAAERVESRRRSEARNRRLSALRPVPEALPF